MRAKVQVAIIVSLAALLGGCTTTERPEPVSPPPVAQNMTDDYDGDTPHRVAGTLGIALEDSDAGLLIGGNYEYRLKQGIGLGVLVDYTGGELDATVVAGAFYLRPEEPLRLLLGMGFEDRDGDSEFLLRLGGSYMFPLENENLTLDPGVYIDFVDGDQKLLFTVGLGISF